MPGNVVEKCGGVRGNVFESAVDGMQCPEVFWKRQ